METCRVIARARLSGTPYEWTVAGSYSSVLIPWTGKTRPYVYFRNASNGTAWEQEPIPGGDTERVFEVFILRVVRSAQASDVVLLCDELTEALARIEAKERAAQFARAAEETERLRKASVIADFRASVEPLVKLLKGKRQNVRLDTKTDGKKTEVTIGATVYGPWAVHTSLRGKGYSVTLISKGLALAQDVPLATARWIVARLISECPAWRDAIPADDSPAKLRALCISRAPFVPAEEILRNA